MEIYVKVSISIFSPSFLVFKRNFIRRVDFACLAASNTANDDVTNYTLIIFFCSFYSRNSNKKN